MKRFNEKQLFAILLFVGMIFWGGSWPSSKILTQYTSTEVITFWRFFFALLTFVPIVFALKVPLRLTPSSLKYLLLASFSIHSILFSSSRACVLVLQEQEECL
ncbi:EamA family transporter [Wolinella succinogenes]|uniref:EamA family transporter n=1 Tax=Wolinella succinogenes TaxID=844 RepID=UPI001E3B5012|nr:EamA family transporter [Wolinella succinogenes]